MKNVLILLTALATAGASFAQVDPTRPMVTGRGNVSTQPAKVIVTNQTAAKPEETLKLEKFQVTGSLMRSAEKKVEPAKR